MLIAMRQIYKDPAIGIGKFHYVYLDKKDSNVQTLCNRIKIENICNYCGEDEVGNSYFSENVILNPVHTYCSEFIHYYITQVDRYKDNLYCKDCVRLKKKFDSAKKSMSYLDDLPETKSYKENCILRDKQQQLRYEWLLNKNKHYRDVINEMYVDKSKKCCDCEQSINKDNVYFLQEGYYIRCPMTGWEGW
eukprot:m.45011 g.45011  ORF g.45011 m.45011 type:complete len:191 (+) comp10172_c0_seq1:146-718(+)